MRNRQSVYAPSRREFVVPLGGVVVAWALSARAQQRLTPLVGCLYAGSESDAAFIDGFRQGLSETGYVEGRNVEIESHFAQNEIRLLPQLIDDLVRRQVAVIVTPGSLSASLAAKARTRTIPIVFGIGGDPVARGLVASLGRPGGNLTGITYLNVDLVPKRFQLLYELVPQAKRFAVLVNPNNPAADLMLGDLKTVVSSSDRQIEVVYAATAGEIDSAFESFEAKRVEALLVNPDILFAANNVKVVALAARYRIPTIYGSRSFTDVGGLMSYGDKRAESFRVMGKYTGRILAGEQPANMPVVQPARFEFIINLRTANSLGLRVSRTLSTFADELIESEAPRP